MRQLTINLLRFFIFLCIFSMHHESWAFTTLADRLMMVAPSIPIASYVQGCGNSINANTTTITCPLTSVAAGDLIVVCANWTYSGSSSISSVTDGTSTFTQGAVTTDGNEDYGQCFFLLAANGGNQTYTVNFGVSNGAVSSEMWVMQMHTTSGTWHLDTSAGAGNYNTTNSYTPNFTTTAGTGEVIVNDHKLFNYGATTSSPSIGGHTPTEPSWSPLSSPYDHDYYLLNTAVSASNATLTYSATTDWVNIVMAFYASTTNPCSELPSYSLQLLSTAVSAGSVNSWPDSSGNGNTVTTGGSIPIAGTSDPTPNGKQTVILGGNQAGTFSTLPTSTAYTVCAVYKLNGTSTKQTFTSNNYFSGAFAYFTNSNSGGPQGADESYVANIGSATDSPTTTWTDTCVSYSEGSSLVFYRNGSVDPTSVNQDGNGTSNGINQLFQNYDSTESANMTIAELDIIVGTAINSTQATAMHNCAASRWTVP